MLNLRAPIVAGLLCLALLPLTAVAQIGGTGWTPKTVTFNVQSPTNAPRSARYWITNNPVAYGVTNYLYHCLTYSNDGAFSVGNTTLPRTEQRFTPDYTSGEIQYEAMLFCPSNENSYCVFQIHTGDAQSPTFGSTTFMAFWFTSNGGSVHDYSGTELANHLGNQWFQLNIDHNLVTRQIKVWINKKLVWTQQDNGAGDFYMKDGVYEQSHGPTLQMDTDIITNSLKMWTSSGTNPPAAPTGLTATPAISTIGLTWNSSVDATNYNVKRSTTNGGPYTNLASTAGTNYTDATVTTGPTYYYVVTAVDQFGESSNSTQASATLVNLGFQLSAAPPLAAVNAGSSTNYTVTMTTNSAFTGSSVTLGIGGLPVGATASFTPPTLSAPGTSTLSVQTSTNTPGGNFALTIGGTNGSGVYTTSATLAVTGTAANPGTLLWNSGSGTDTNWITARNWTNSSAGGFGPPGTNNTLVFSNTATASASAITSPGSGVVTTANINSFVNGSFAVLGLTNLANAINTSPNYHNLGIANGANLTVDGTFQVGGFTTVLFPDNNVANLTVSGAGATLQVTNGGVTVSEDATNGPNNNATLDLSGLDNFTMNGTQIRIGVEGSGSAHHASGVIYLAKTNSLILTTSGYTDSSGSGSPSSGNPALYIGHNASTFGNGSKLYLGISNALFLDYATIGRGDTNALVAFNPAVLGLNPTVLIRGTNGGSTRVGVYVVGDGSAGAQANNAPSTNDFSGGTVDAMIGYLCVGRGRSGNSSSVGGTGVLTFDQGTINANALALGFIYANGSNSPAMGTVNVNGTATLTVVSNLTLSSQAVTTGGAFTLGQGTLNVNGGTVQSTNILGGGGISTVNLNSGTVDLQSGNPAPGNIANVSTLNLGANTATDPALLVNAATISASNAIVIAANGTLAGNTVITAPGLTVNGAISPGTNGPGWMTNNGPVTLGAGGSFVVTANNATSGPAIGWSFLKINGGVNVQASNGNPFVVQLQSAGPAANFSYGTNYDWVIATASSGITNFSAAKFSVDSSLFANDLAGGYFFVRSNANSLILSFTNNHPPAAGPVTLTRTGTVMAIPLATLATQWSDPDGDPVTLGSVNSSSAMGANNVGTDGTYLYYTNASNVADTISYTVQDVRTNPPAIYQPGDTIQTAIGTVTILPAQPFLAGPALQGGNLILSGTGGVPTWNYYVLSSTNLTQPLGLWTRIATNAFDGSGNFHFTNALDPNQPQQFYLLQAP